MALPEGTDFGKEYELAERLLRADRFAETLAIYQHLAETDPAGSRVFRRIAWMYSHGKGTPKNPVKAEEWTTKAAEAGSPAAQLHLAGRLSRQSRFQEARSWLECASSNGYAPAIYYLGRMYELGIGMPNKDVERAYEYFEKAAARKDCAEFRGARHDRASLFESIAVARQRSQGRNGQSLTSAISKNEIG